MEFRTKINIEPSGEKITYNDKVMFIGSCFASEMGSQMKEGKMQVMINPAGAVYNPVSVCKTLDIISSGRNFTIEDLYNHEGTWLSFYHYTDFSDTDSSKVLNDINRKSQEALAFLEKAKFLFVTFGTARVYRWKKTGSVVSNCHKIPSVNFENELLDVEDIVSLWSDQLEKLHKRFPGLRVYFTVSPVRHWKDGAYGNQVSKSVLFLAIDRLRKHNLSPGYFPAYELLMDDLRDYRFYNDDMLHPSPAAVNYIWDSFAGCFMDKKTIATWIEIAKIGKALHHRFNTHSPSGMKKFAERMLEQITRLEETHNEIDFTNERNHFSAMLNH